MNAIKYPERAKQAIDYGGIRVNNILPTDIDGIIEYKDKGYILIEMKHRDTGVPLGQKIALERMVDDFRRAGKIAFIIVCSHDVDDCNEVIRAENTVVTNAYYDYRWFSCRIPLGEMIDRLIRWFE